jgi:hypothetical protein
MRRGVVIGVLGLVAALGLVGVWGCQSLTPEQQQKVDAASTALTDAAKKAEAVKATFDAYAKEYDAIKTRVDAGESIPAVLVSRYQQLAGLLAQTKVDVVEAVEKVKTAKASLVEALDAGVKWYSFLQPVLLILLGVAGGYFPAAAPALGALRTVIQGVSVYAKANPAQGDVLKKAILAKSREPGVKNKLTVDGYVQRFDPKAAA